MDRSEHLAGILADWHLRRERGESLAPEEVVRRHPELAQELRERFATIEAIDERFGVYAAIPKQIGEFRILREIGRGGMGIVYEAEQPSMRRRVALKVLLPSIVASPKAVRRFQREAQAAGSLKHTNIVAIHQMGQEGGIWFSAMELVEGRPLGEVIDTLRKARRGRTPSRDSMLLTGSRTGSQSYYTRVAEMFGSVAEALQVAHDHGVIHRDVKPSNLLLDVQGELRLVDFGLARLDDAASMTITGDVVGTPTYMSPEQILGTRTIDHRSDVYSLGATLYEALALRPPFVAPSLTALIQRITSTDPRGLRGRDRSLPKDLETIVLKALEKDPARRFPSAGEMAQELRRFAGGVTIRARPIGPLGRAWRLAKRHKVRSALVAAVLLALAVGGLALRVAQRETVERERLTYEALCRQADLAATAEWSIYEGEAPQAERRSEAHRLFTKAIEMAPDRWEAYLGRALVRFRLPGTGLEDELRDIQRARDRGLPERTALLARAFLFSEGHILPRFPADAARDLKLARTLFGESALDDYLEGRVLAGQRRWVEAEAVLSRGLDRNARDQGPLRWLALYRRALLRERLGNWSGALEDYSAARQLVGDDSLDGRMRIAAYLLRLEQTQRATERFEAIVEEAAAADLGDLSWWGLLVAALQSGDASWSERVLALGMAACPDSPLLLGTRFDALFDRGEAEAALALLDGATEAQRSDWAIHNRRGRALSRLGRDEEALEAYAAALERTPRWPEWLHTNRAQSFRRLGRADDAWTAVERALERHPDFAPALSVKASLLLDRDQIDEALVLSTRAIGLTGEAAVAWTGNVHASILLRKGDVDAALSVVDAALLADPDDVEARLVRSRILRERGDHEGCLASLEKVLALDPANKTAHKARALLLINDLHRPAEALRAFEALVALPSMKNAPEAHTWIGNLHQMQGHFEEAVAAYDVVLQAPAPALADVDLGLAYSNKAACLARLRRFDEAFVAAEEAWRRARDEPMAVLNAAGAYLEGGRLDKARALFQHVTDLAPGMAPAHFYLGLCCAGLGDGPAALRALDAYVAKVAQDPNGWYERGRVLADLLDQPENAIPSLEKALQLGCDPFRGNLLLGYALLGSGEFRRSLAAYDKALAYNPDFLSAAVNRAYILMTIGDADEVRRGIAEFERCRAAEESPGVLTMFARSLALCPRPECRDPARAERLARRALELAPADAGPDADLLNTLGVALGAGGKWKEAVVPLEAAAKARDGGNGVDWIYLALAHANLGERSAAEAYRPRAEAWIEENGRRDPELRRAREAVAELLD